VVSSAIGTINNLIIILSVAHSYPDILKLLHFSKVSLSQ
jgi:hypothetical protein